MRIRSIIRILFPKVKYILNFITNYIRGNRLSFFSVISKGTLINYCKIDAYSYIGPYCLLNTVVVGRYTSIGPYVIIGGSEHSYWWYSTSHFISKYNIGGQITTIGNDVWIGAHAVIKQGITIGNGAIIGAGAIVLSNVEPFSIVVGVPAKKIKMRFESSVIFEIEKSRYWDNPPRKAKLVIRETLPNIEN
jgi:acetyltransferase-like isoleucine patch superfamily enzyme